MITLERYTMIGNAEDDTRKSRRGTAKVEVSQAVSTGLSPQESRIHTLASAETMLDFHRLAFACGRRPLRQV